MTDLLERPTRRKTLDLGDWIIMAGASFVLVVVFAGFGLWVAAGAAIALLLFGRHHV